MDDVIFGLLAVAAGALFCLRGYLAFRIVIPLWTAFLGFGVRERNHSPNGSSRDGGSPGM